MVEKKIFKSLNLSSVNFKIISFNDLQIQHFSLLLLPSACQSWSCQVPFPLLLQRLLKMKWIVPLNFEWSSSCSMTAKKIRGTLAFGSSIYARGKLPSPTSVLTRQTKIQNLFEQRYFKTLAAYQLLLSPIHFAVQSLLLCSSNQRQLKAKWR